MSGAGIVLDSGLWIDREDAVARIAARHATGELADADAAALTHFADQGYVVLRPAAAVALADELVAGIDRLWRERPHDLAYAYDGPARRFSRADPARERRPRSRIHDPHSHLDAARALYLDAELHRWIGLVLGEAPVAIQSLLFEFGSEQTIHRDPVVVPTGAPGHMVAAWMALEDISPDSGALVYVPGSHRLPYFEFAPGEWQFDGSRMGGAEVEAALAFHAAQMRERGLALTRFTPKKGEVLLWHASLIHGGAPVTAPGSTRKSFVVHYSTQRTYRERSITLAEPVAGGAPGEERRVVWETTRLLEHAGVRGFDNPLRGAPRG
jgi:hypothetical protein